MVDLYIITHPTEARLTWPWPTLEARPRDALNGLPDTTEGLAGTISTKQDLPLHFQRRNKKRPRQGSVVFGRGREEGQPEGPRMLKLRHLRGGNSGDSRMWMKASWKI